MGSVLDLMTLTKRTLTEDQIAAVIRDSLMGLLYLHKAQIIHRDLKSGLCTLSLSLPLELH
jgi:serine/threonine kinase 3